MIYGFHGNLGEPSDWLEVFEFIPREKLEPLVGTSSIELWNLYNCLEENMQSFAQKTCAEISRLRSRPNILFGYSLGGRLAYQCLVENPSAWDAAVIVSAHPGLDDEKAREARVVSDLKWAQKSSELEWPKFWSAWCAQDVFKDSSRSKLRTQAPTDDPRKLEAVFERYSLGLQQDLSADLKQLKLPVLLVSGEKDSKYSALNDSLSSKNDSIESLVLSGCGHRVLHEKPAELASEILAFLQRHFRAKT